MVIGLTNDDTISAIATAVGEGGIGIIRLSGDKSISIADKIFASNAGKRVINTPSHRVLYGTIIDPENNETVDEALILVMRAPRSYTCEDIVEIHCHGGPVPLQRVLAITLGEGARLAEPGEFTKRAFLNGRLDLAQAEAVIDIIRSKTDASLKAAVGNLSGRLSEQVKGLRHAVLRMIAQLEAAIDFPEEDIEEAAAADVAELIKQADLQLASLLATAQTGRILREGLATVIIGKPNVGKSSLLNALLREKRAIVTDIPGTTRDIIEEYVNIRGIPLKIIDTAGIRETADVVERIGVERAKELVGQADLILLLLDSSTPLATEDKSVLTLLSGKQALVLINKSDLPARLEVAEVEKYTAGRQVLKISVTQGMGLEQLEKEIVNMVYSGQINQGEAMFVNNVRHANALRQAQQRLADALTTIEAGMPTDCIVIDLRAAWEKLGEITGDTVGEDIIDQIFTQFCIGK
ncbi:tRNA modification GTPase MnmE [Sporomusa acidovorans DSM 3132]|uniref:tRNA modification GTPase MnmE n=1 Tax=Sporomusa acidovorans (strain ATCC 49682 / DSM 3132 / Mol) TaxID=1123286 RepID=A0ABZ3JB32_SPOA4|nr:tRNA uridine-5-carboxymethylaminomethyl(34) synthesis GTPase MnmE [Sporomusa acidovorans]OZC22658.1 tRNA modification GTPase MnmE [Sporomusa acidovorans DSM 3132]SDE77197.1 tRNA modification GTPase [Sporomusa acidovorans]